eukprot:scaffold112755_cov63-Attheya_sp.AAC.1
MSDTATATATLAQFLGIEVSPLTNNIAAALLTVVYVQVVLGAGGVIQARLGADVSRKFIHVMAGAILRDANDEDVRTMSRSSSPSELLYGPLQFTIIMNWLGLFHFMSEEAAIIMAALGFGDGIAPLIGKYCGKHSYRMPLSSKKTLEGSIGGVFLGTIGGAYFFSYMLGIPVLPLQVILTLATIAMVVEGTSFNNCDNILLPVAMLYSLKYVKEMFV